MVITELSLVEYYDKIIPRAKRKNYKLQMGYFGDSASC